MVGNGRPSPRQVQERQVAGSGGRPPFLLCGEWSPGRQAG